MSMLTVSILVIISSASLVTSLPNIRIQVNSENLQNPPYLLDAIKQVEKAEQRAASAAAAASTQDHGATGVLGPQPSNDPISSAANERSIASLNENNNRKLLHQDNLEQAKAVSSLSATKDGTIDEIPDLDSESVLALSPESIMGGSMEALEHPPMQSSPLEHEQKDDSKQVSNNNRNFQLDVTSSHLKRPSAAASSQLIEEEQLSGESSQRAPMIRPHLQQQATPDGPGAKSRVSPSVANEEPAALLQSASSGQASPAVSTGAKLDEKIAASPPDTWEPSQVMQGVTNASLVPATIKRQYGHQTRTRITLGGGYQREQQPPLVNPSSSEYVDSKPEKPVAPLERPTREHQPAGSLDNSRTIEIPERIVVPVTVFTKQQSSRNTTSIEPPSASVQQARKRDTRCPSNGITSLEHPTACDKYFLCEDGYSSEQVCPNGLMYGTRDIVRDFCVHRWQAVCGDKSIPNPISSPGCRWQNGIFNVQGSPKCTPDFYECTDGLFEVKKCTISGQVYDDKTKSCQYAEQVGCAQEALADFQCPTDDQSNTYWPFPRYFLNERALIHCVSDKPQIIRCRDHERVDPEHLFCVPIDKSAPPVNEDGSPAEAEVSARRASNTQREKGKKVQKTGNT